MLAELLICSRGDDSISLAKTSLADWMSTAGFSRKNTSNKAIQCICVRTGWFFSCVWVMGGLVREKQKRRGKHCEDCSART